MGADGAVVLAALQLADSALPIGRFAHSYGLEALLGHDAAMDERAIEELVETIVREGVGPLDGAALAHAHRAATAGDAARLIALDRHVTVRKLSPAARIASTSCGRRLAALVPAMTAEEPCASFAALIRSREAQGNLAVLEGALAAVLGLDTMTAVLLELRGHAAALLSAAVRLGRLSARQAQEALWRLAPALLAATEEARSLPIAELRASTPEAEVFALLHARAETRHFAT